MASPGASRHGLPPEAGWNEHTGAGTHGDGGGGSQRGVSQFHLPHPRRLPAEERQPDAERAAGRDLAYLYSDIHPAYYEKLGFTRYATDVCYSRSPAARTPSE